MWNQSQFNGSEFNGLSSDDCPDVICIETAFAYLLANAGLPVQSISPIFAPQTSAKPYLVYNMVSSHLEYNLDATPSISTARMQVDVYDLTENSVVSIIEQLRLLLEGYSGQTECLPILNIMCEKSLMFTELLLDGSDRRIFHGVIDSIVLFQESQ